jgi:hypothetical protein
MSHRSAYLILALVAALAGSAREIRADGRTPSFKTDVMPLFDRFGCNGAACHGKAEGRGGLKLSVFSSDPRSDWEHLVQRARGRRVFPAAPDRSLVLLKATAAGPHTGGKRFDRDSDAYRTLRDWIAAGVPFSRQGEPTITRIKIEPEEKIVRINETQELRVEALFSDGSSRDVTRLALYRSNGESLASVSKNGVVQIKDRPGHVAITASFLNHFAVFQALVPRPRSDSEKPKPDRPQWKAHNFIDRITHARLKDLGIEPSALSSDTEFLRRVFVDIIGTLPTPTEVRQFIDDPRPQRRARIVDKLLERPEYADYWALKWADVLRVDRTALGHKSAYAFSKWLRESFAANTPYDRFVREILTARGVLSDAPQGYYYKVVGDPGKIASELSQTFLGLRIACAQCHHHPYDVWGQQSYYGMKAFFTQVTFKGTSRGEAILASGDPQTKHPRSGEIVFPHALGTAMSARAPRGDRRAHLADWLVQSENPWFSRNIANRMWAHFTGRGLVEPVDDLRATNPPTNPELLDALADHVIETGYDLKALIRTITASRVYQLSSTPNATNRDDEQSYSRAYLKPLDAEVLLDAVCQATGIPEKFEGVPSGSRAIRLWDSSLPHYFLRLFGRPVRKSACVCERNPDTSVAQALHLMNSPQIHAKLTHDGGNVARAVARSLDDVALVDELYLNFFSRFPDDAERQICGEYLRDSKDRRSAAEDIAWSMLCSVEFVFRR